MAKISFKDFENSDGTIDWTALRKAETDDGDRCNFCGSFILFGGQGYQQECQNCKDLKSGRENTEHKSLVRCPSCGHTQNVHDYLGCEWGLYEEGEHEVFCSSCDKSYLVQTRVNYTFESMRGETDET